MCGRYVNYEDVQALAAALGISADDPALVQLGAKPRYNIAPTQQVFGVRHGDAEPGPRREGAAFHWGLVPFWAKEKSIGNRMINARSETVFEKPAFRAAIKKRRCVIPASGFYEWQKRGSGPKQPHFIHRADSAPILFAGLWEHWDKEDPPLESCSILTTGANRAIAEIHLRMPVILAPESVDRWLDPASDRSEIEPLLEPCPDDWLATRPVSTRVNKPINDGPELLEEEEVGP